MTLEYVNHLDCDNTSFSLRSAGLSVPPRIFLTRAPGSTSVLGCFGSHMPPLLGHYGKKVSALLSFVHSMSLSIDMNLILSSEDSGFCRSKISQNAS